MSFRGRILDSALPVAEATSTPQRVIPRPRAELVFDLDDTLIGSFEAYAAAHRRVAADLGFSVLGRPKLVPYHDDFRSTLQRQYPGADVERFIARFDEIAHEYRASAIAGVSDALQQLSESGCRLWIVTGRSRARLAKRMAEAGLSSDLFAGIFPSDDQPELKPSPRCFEPVWECLGQHPSHQNIAPTIYIGDRQGDRVAAEAAAIGFVAVCTGPEAEAGFPHDLHEDFVLQSAAELPAWLDRNIERLK